MRTEEARRLIHKGETGKAIKLLLRFIDKLKENKKVKKVRDRLDCLCSELNRAELDFQDHNCITYEEYIVVFVRVTMSLIKLIRTMD